MLYVLCNQKETYLTLKGLRREVSRLRDETGDLNIRQRQWEASMDRSLLIVTDLQNYFLSPESHAFIPSAPAIVQNISNLIRFYTVNHRPVIFTKHVNDTENAGSMAYWWKDLIEAGTWMSEIHDDLPTAGGLTLTKHQYDAFHQTDLEKILKENQVQYPVICGVMTNLCCETTARSAFVRGLRPVIPLDATAAYNREFHLASFRNLCFGFMPLLSTQEIIEMLKT